MNSRLSLGTSRLLVLACGMAALAWAFIVLLICSAGVAYYLRSQYYIVVPIAGFLLVVSIYLILAMMAKCRNCKNRILIQGFTPPKFINENKVWGMIGWSGIVLNVLTHKKFTCMHCGEKYEISIKA